MSSYSGEPHFQGDQRAGNHSGEPHGQHDQRAGQSMRCYQSIWMARMTQTSCSAIPQVQTGLSLSLMGNKDIGAKKFAEVTDMRTVRILNEDVTLNERLDCQPFSMLNVYQNIGFGMDSKNDLDNLSHGGVSMPQLDFKTDKTVAKFNPLPGMADHGAGLREHVFQSKMVSQCFEEPATQIIPYGSNKGKAAQLSFMERHEKVKQLTLGSTSKDYLISSIIGTKQERNHDFEKKSILGHNKNWDEHSSREFATSLMRPGNASLLLHDTSVDHNYEAFFAGGKSKKMQKVSHTELFPNRNNSMKETKSRNFTAKSSHGLAGGSATFSQMTRNLLSLKNTDIKKSKQGISEPSDSMKSNRNMFSQLLSLSQPLSMGQTGVEIQLLDNSSESQGKHDIKETLKHGLCQNNESSAETATMDMESFKQRNSLSGVNSSTSIKNISVGHDPLSQATGDSAGKKAESKRVRTRIPNMNEFPVIQCSSNSMDNAQPSTSKTQSLDAEHLLFNSELPINSKTSRFQHGLPTIEPINTLEPSSRWLKRHKLSVPHSCYIGTKSSNTGEALSHRKVAKLLSKVIEGTKICSSLESFEKGDCKKEITGNQSAIVRLNLESSSMDPAEKDLDILLTHSWIKRWCATQKKKLEAVVVCEPQSTKMDFDELGNKQFPSIGAMALMGKAMNGVQSCEFQKKGSLVLWNTGGLSSGRLNIMTNTM